MVYKLHNKLPRIAEIISKGNEITNHEMSEINGYVKDINKQLHEDETAIEAYKNQIKDLTLTLTQIGKLVVTERHNLQDSLNSLKKNVEDLRKDSSEVKRVARTIQDLTKMHLDKY